MSFFKAFKRSLGFGGSDEDDDITYTDSEEEQTEEATGQTEEQKIEITDLKFDPKVQEQIFAKVVEIFNSSLPKFVAETVDIEAQKKYLLEALDQSIRDYMTSLNSQAEKNCEIRWEQSRSAMVAELEAMRTKTGDIEKRSDEVLQKQLSADRQKRALTDRVHDLEAQIAKMQAEHEQFDLENRSLVNRLKVANIQLEDLEKANEEVARLQAEILKMRQNPGEIQAQEIETLKAQIAEMENGIESLKEQNRVSSEMLSDSHHKLTKLEKEAGEKEAQLAEAQELLKQYDEVTAKMEQIDQIMTRNEQKIKKQKALIDERDKEIEALRNTISENMRLQAEREKALQEEIKSLKGNDNIPFINFSDEIPEESVPQISEDELSEIEQTFESGEWFTNTPPPETPSMRPKDADSDFGYREPQRKTHNTGENSLQLSLF